eukprot:TRINITY_DN4375_c0_g1_i1.p1 TRINITY_DN4375_c0_g1~~TRINITY_DN4375_c0_g1_i1.p1  ORF type:complete len:100 (-),score=3.32 TRINITY_DN4375_c0_g1_i1:23-322(-)
MCLEDVPAEKVFPLAVRMTNRAVWSRSAKASVTSCMTSSLKALWRMGLLSVTVTTPLVLKLFSINLKLFVEYRCKLYFELNPTVLMHLLTIIEDNQQKE